VRGLSGAVAAIVAACGGAPTPPQPVQNRAAAAPAATTWRFQQLALGSARASATRTTFELSFEGDRATLREHHARASGSFTLDTIDGATWVEDAATSYRGPRAQGIPSVFTLDLTAPGVQRLFLWCRDDLALLLAPAGAPRLPLDCGGHLLGNALVPVTDPIVCGAELPYPGQDDDEDRLSFAKSPGIERVDVNDGCEVGQIGLRLAR
jgi:hypothetical protein